MIPSYWSPILTSLEVATLASIFAFILALGFAWWLTHRPFHGKVIVETLFLLPLVLPPSVVGLGLLIVGGRRSPFGQGFEYLFHQPLVFSFPAAVLAAMVVAFPLVYQTLKIGFARVDNDLEDAARTMGAKEAQVFIYVTIPLAWPALVTALSLGFARALGEFGATMMFAGNIPGKTQTIPTAIYLAVETGDTKMAILWSLFAIGFSFLLLSISRFLYR
ncbi:molybdate ABC transporter permease subunit [Marininema halotolerans]|uniref:Molybdenum transport system permease n=1 Tax=Marininema halotolerans TaxID=1155944 RepID=A0A1I6RGA9_9BACL|nr:molybdate ABC transporter permease subunit [Marininema halotolerans]SFS63771.1 molybdate transport system permease protein [Marininema halotolerans]